MLKSFEPTFAFFTYLTPKTFSSLSDCLRSASVAPIIQEMDFSWCNSAQFLLLDSLDRCRLHLWTLEQRTHTFSTFHIHLSFVWIKNNKKIQVQILNGKKSGMFFETNIQNHSLSCLIDSNFWKLTNVNILWTLSGTESNIDKNEAEKYDGNFESNFWQIWKHVHLISTQISIDIKKTNVKFNDSNDQTIKTNFVR